MPKVRFNLHKHYENKKSITYHQLPYYMFSEELGDKISNDARVLYSLLLSRLELSFRNSLAEPAWVDAAGDVYVIFSRKAMGEALGKSEPTARAAVKCLTKLGFLEEKRCGQGKPNHIYLLVPDESLTKKPQKAPVAETKPPIEPAGLYRPEEKTQTVPTATVENNEALPQHKTDEKAALAVVNRNYEETEQAIKNNIEYERLHGEYESVSYKAGLKLLSQTVSVLTKSICKKYEGGFARISGDYVPEEMLKDVFFRLRYEDIKYFIEKYFEQTKPIKKVERYIMASLYNNHGVTGFARVNEFKQYEKIIDGEIESGAIQREDKYNFFSEGQQAYL